MRPVMLLLSACFLFFGCAAGPKAHTSEKNKGQVVTCSGSALNWDRCYKAADELCGEKGYDIIEKISDAGPMVSGEGAGGFGGPVMDRYLIIVCKQ